MNATLFCPLDELDTATNTTTCYLDGTATSATVNVAENVTLASGVIMNAFDFKEGAYVQTNFDWNESRSLSVFAFFRVDELPGHYWNDIVYLVGNRLSVRSDSTLVFYLDFDDGSNLQDGVSVEPRKTYAVLWTVDNTNKVTRLVMWDAETKEKLFDKSWSFAGKSIRSYTGAARISDLAGYGLNGMIDEVRIYEGRVLSDDEALILFHINRYKFATLSAPSATYNGTAFLVNVTASLPGDGGSYLLPAPVNATSSYSSVGSIGNFTFLDVGNASTASFIIPAEPGKAVPGLRELAIETDSGLYAYGTGKLNLATPLSTPLAKPSLITNTIQDGKVVAINWSGIDTFSKLQPSAYITSTSGSANLTILQDSDKLMKLNLDAPLKLYFQNLLPIMTYDVSNGQDKIGSFKTDTLGTASYTAPAGTIYIGTPENIQQVMSNNLTSLLTKILVIALMAGIFVEMTKTRLDDEMVALIIGLLVVLVILAILHYL